MVIRGQCLSVCRALAQVLNQPTSKDLSGSCLANLSVYICSIELKAEYQLQVTKFIQPIAGAIFKKWLTTFTTSIVRQARDLCFCMAFLLVQLLWPSIWSKIQGRRPSKQPLCTVWLLMQLIVLRLRRRQLTANMWRFLDLAFAKGKWRILRP